MKKWSDIKAKKMTPERKERLEAEIRTELLAMELADVRKIAGMTQAKVAAEADMTQSELSRFEGREDFLLSSLRRYARALGGELEVAIVLGDHRVRLRSV